MRKIRKTILLLLFPIILFGQDNGESKKAYDEVNKYVKQIDSIYENSKEGIAEGPIEYTKPKRKNGGWEAYFINDSKGLPLRIRYGKTEFDRNINLNLYYKNEKLVFADLTVTLTSRKMKNKTPYKRQFHFPEGRLQWQTRTTSEEYQTAEMEYSFEYLKNEDSLIRKMIYK
ncbi:hypothetical protein [Flavobacterium sp.]|uniref:hypothetical protein n=1 Tax=Flavobacterium sp. TaxID=239 RepID=UPI002619F74C|nr:hypothetical protein [Flavobacterium sp.]